MATTQKSDPAVDAATSPAPGPAADVPASTAGLKGRSTATAVDVAELRGAELLAAAQEKAPSLTAEFVKAFELSDAELVEIARGAVPPPPTVGPAHTVDLHLTPGGWQVTPVGVSPQDVGTDAISR